MEVIVNYRPFVAMFWVLGSDVHRSHRSKNGSLALSSWSQSME
jgi:hypothetical protein